MVCLCSWGKNVKRCLNNPSCLTWCIGVTMRFNVAQRDRAPWLHMLLACVVCVCPTCLTLICAAWEIAWASPRRDRTKRTPKKKIGRQETPNRNTSELWHILHIFTSHHINFTSTSASGEWHPAPAPTQSRSPPIAIQGAAFGRNSRRQTSLWK